MAININVPPVNERDHISDQTILQLVREIVSGFNPQKIILFGSYSTAVQKPESDLDILVIMDTALREVVQAQLIRQYLKPMFGLDLIVYTPANLKKRLELGDYFLKEIVSKGKILYESPHR